MCCLIDQQNPTQLNHNFYFNFLFYYFHIYELRSSFKDFIHIQTSP